MDSRDFIVLGLVGVGGWLAWRWYKNRTGKAPGTPSGDASSSMTDTGARTTVFGGGIMFQKLLSPTLIHRDATSDIRPRPTAPPIIPIQNQNRTFIPVRNQVVDAVLAPLPISPSPSGQRFVLTGITAPAGTSPDGDQPQPGDPGPETVIQTRTIGGLFS